MNRRTTSVGDERLVLMGSPVRLEGIVGVHRPKRNYLAGYRSARAPIERLFASPAGAWHNRAFRPVFRKLQILTITPPAANASVADPLASVEALGGVGYIASRRIATALFMAVKLQKPILVEGSAGVGKTELALSTATML